MTTGLSGTGCESFAAIDFETADNGADSACALALVRVENGSIVARHTMLMRPPRPQILFSWLHGITWDRVKDAPTFAEAWPSFLPFLEGVQFLAAHNAPFDKGVLGACLASARLPAVVKPFLCTVKVARNVWSIRPTKLPDVCRFLQLSLKHHDAASDADACARIVIAALNAGHTSEALLGRKPRTRKPTFPSVVDE